VGKTSHFLAVNVNRRYVQNRNYFARQCADTQRCDDKFWYCDVDVLS